MKQNFIKHNKSHQLYVHSNLFLGLLKVGSAGIFLSALTSSISFIDFILLVWLLPNHLSFNEFLNNNLNFIHIKALCLAYSLPYYNYGSILRNIIAYSASFYGLLTLFIGLLNSGFKVKYGHLIANKSNTFGTKLSFKQLAKLSYPNAKTLLKITLLSNVLIIVFSYIFDILLLQYALSLEIKQVNLSFLNNISLKDKNELITYYSFIHSFILNTTRNFLYYRTLTLLLLPWINIFSGIILLEGYLKKDIFVNLITILFNVFFDFIFVYYTNLSLYGIAVGTLMARILEFIIVMFIYFKHINYKNEKVVHLSFKFYLFAFCSLAYFSLGEIFNSLGQTLYSVLFIYFIQIIVPSNLLAISLLGAILPISNFFNSVLIGFSRKIGGFFSINYAKGNLIRFRNTFYLVLLFNVIISLFIYGICCNEDVMFGLLKIYRISNNEGLLNANKNFTLFLWRSYTTVWLSTSLIMPTKGLFKASNKAGYDVMISIVRRWVFYICGLLIFSRFSTYVFLSNAMIDGMLASIIILSLSVIYLEKMFRNKRKEELNKIKMIKVIKEDKNAIQVIKN